MCAVWRKAEWTTTVIIASFNCNRESLFARRFFIASCSAVYSQFSCKSSSSLRKVKMQKLKRSHIFVDYYKKHSANCRYLYTYIHSNMYATAIWNVFGANRKKWQHCTEFALNTARILKLTSQTHNTHCTLLCDQKIFVAGEGLQSYRRFVIWCVQRMKPFRWIKKKCFYRPSSFFDTSMFSSENFLNTVPRPLCFPKFCPLTTYV